MLLNWLGISRESDPYLGEKILGYLFLSLAIVGGLYFLFEGLIPYFGYLESGAIICGILAFLGGILLFIGRGKTSPPHESLIHQMGSYLKQLEIEKVVKNNSLALSLLSFGIGIVLSQVKDPKKLAEIYKMLK